ncbi:Hsp70 family protein [Rhodococcus sp. AW25M09]|uniref:Hsp70 family protein n=1 Tax=Rhodococcus sp. AW25M09 TaxID=1268303 RepID=UPI0012FC9E42|nr:Hsp70 family protein [Rhodococcus sp. AW25M09]
MSTGSEVVCAALVSVDSDGSREVEYRTVSADRQANTDMGVLVTSAIELMASLIPGHRSPDVIAVTYRTEEHAAGIRAALAHTTRDVRLVPESAAATAHLATTGLIDGYDTISFVDLGASGLSVTATDRAAGTVLSHGRSDAAGGDTLNALVKNLVQDMTRDNLRDDIRDDRGIGSARYRSIKEQLSRADEVQIERYSGIPLTVTRDAFDTAASPIFDSAAEFVREVFDDSAYEPQAIVLIGGGAHVPLLATTLTDIFHAPVIRLPEPDAVLAIGAATVAASIVGSEFQLVAAARNAGGRMSRYSGAIAAAVVAGGLVLAYGVQAMNPGDDPSVSPAGSAAQSAAQSAAESGGGGPIADGYSIDTDRPTRGSTPGERFDPTRTTIDSTGSSAQFTTAAPPTTTPTLRPGPDLPAIEWPAGSTPDRPSPEATSDASVEPSPAVTTIPVPSAAPSETSEPGESSPAGPAPTPESTPEATPEFTQVPTESITVPTTETASDPTPELTAPPTVWSPPVAAPEASGVTSEPRTSSDSATPRPPEPSASDTQGAQPGT